MSTGSLKRYRSNLPLPPGQWARMFSHLRRGDVLLRLGLCLASVLLMWLFTRGWLPPFGYRIGDVPPRDIVARIEFRLDDREATHRATTCVYQHEVGPLLECRQQLRDKVFQVSRAESYDSLDPRIWHEFLDQQERGDPKLAQQAFVKFRAALTSDPDLVQFDQVIQHAFTPSEQHGLLEGEKHERVVGDQFFILVHPAGRPEPMERVAVRDVRLTEAVSTLRLRLDQEFKAAMVSTEHADALSRHVLAWLHKRLPPTLKLDREATQRAYEQAERTRMVQRTYGPGDMLASGGKRLTEADLHVLRQEHLAITARLSFGQWLGHFLADMGMYLALFVLCGFFLYYREPDVLREPRRLITLLGLVTVTVGLCSLASLDQWRAEMVPLLLFSMTAAIAYRQELALLLASSVALLSVLSLGQGLVEFVIYVATLAAAIQLLDRIRSRTKLIYVGLCAGVVAALTTVGISAVASQVFGAHVVSASAGAAGPSFWELSSWAFLETAVWSAFCSVLAGVFMTGLLPFIEKLFDVQTDISLLELGDAAHPLLQELVRRAPGTYNHSINVASIGEAAADAIGANGLLVRVGAYFHDIGKMLKPSYYVENQEVGVNRHESLVPAMSTLVIIAHVKDGVDLARQHRLPQSIIDFIEQHHGTTLVEYFYQRAARQQEEDPDRSEVEEASFRYPGPKPQTKEIGVMMVADASEGASRALVEPTPARIESLVHEIIMSRLLDGQFDECGLTLKELATAEDSIVKSLTAVYHGRVKYPEKQITVG